MDLLYIPKKLKVGFQNRDDTFDGKLSYIIYYDEKGNVRKETSWKGWIEEKLPVLELDNDTVTGLSLNKSIQRDNYHFGSGRNMIRVYDPRGFEYEITTDNLIGIINYNDLVKGELQGEYVYAWTNSGHLVLLPKNSEQYKAATQHTTNRNTKVSARDFTAGQVYETKSGERAVYLGRMQYTETSAYDPLSFTNKGKQHVFKNLTTGEFKNFSPAALGTVSSTMEKADLEETIDEFKLSIKSKDFTVFTVRPLEEKDFERFKKIKNRDDVYFAKLLPNNTDLHVVSLYGVHMRKEYQSDKFLPTISVRSRSLTNDTSKTQTTRSYGHSFNREAGFREGSRCAAMDQNNHYCYRNSNTERFSFANQKEADQYVEDTLVPMVYEEWKANGFGVLQVMNNATNTTEDIL